jgi:hypothetical protein
MKNCCAVFALLVFLLNGCSGRASPDIAQLAHPKELVGSYFNQSATYKTGLYLSADGRGGMLSRNNDDSFKQVTTFNWGVDGDVFYMSNIYFSKDGKRIIKAISDDHTAYKFSGSSILSQGKSGQWLEWKRTSNQPDLLVINAISKK